MREYNILVHGDLGTGERLEGTQKSRSIEGKPMRRLQSTLFVFGLFHLQMAAADAIWRMFIEPKAQRMEPNGLYQQACKVRPRDSGRIGSKPGFRLMHDLIAQCATARMLDIWRVETQNRGYSSLDSYAAAASWSDIEEMSMSLVHKYIDKSAAKDQEFRNNTLILGRLLDYVELAHAMKHGDIGRVEGTFLKWAFVFKSVGKHKYSAHLIKTMVNLRFVYPDRLARAIRLNWLCNPSGKRDGFRAIDWLVELMNLYIKVVYSSTGYARTFQLILKQSPLIEVFRQIHRTMQDNFHLLHRSIRHAPPDLTNTINTLCDLLQENKAHVVDESRSSYNLVDHTSTMLNSLDGTGVNNEDSEETGDGEPDEIEEADLEIE
ncbi:hypothetical protein BC629DRAFT_1584883 [Irpex lacteus]|nr:hypothetical protein BC629DRAFT_1584883 [Irpex lacteus]